jgi:hypothetical protein
MTPAAQGRHCAACAKVVLDFTQKTDAEILTLLGRSSSTCGRFRADQLSRPLLPPPVPAPRWRTWLAATATVLGLREAAAEPIAAQQPIAVSPGLLIHNEREIGALWQQVHPAPDTANQLLRGQVVDESTSNGLPGVMVLLKNTQTGVSTAVDGTFELALPSDRAATKYVIQFSSIGYISEERALTTMLGQKAVVTLVQDTQALAGEVVVVGGLAYRQPWPWHPRALWFRLRNAFNR